MRIARFECNGSVSLGFYTEEGIIPLTEASKRCREVVRDADALMSVSNVLELLPHGCHENTAWSVYEWLSANPEELEAALLPLESVRLRRPLENPGKILLLAGNYAAHVREGGEVAPERQDTFPYVFMKPSTTLNDPESPIPIPRVSPDHIDYECELGVVIGRRCKHVLKENALENVAGYVVVNDISDRHYKPFPARKERPKDGFFDWLHGKWHDGFCPMGPCIVSSRMISDPQALKLTQHVNGELRQNAATAQMIFPVAALIAFISQSVTLMPGDVIATGTPEGIGMTTGRFLQPGDVLSAAIEGIGVLRNTVTRED